MQRRRFIFGGVASAMAAIMARPSVASHEPLFWEDEPEDVFDYDDYLERRRRARLRRIKRNVAKKAKPSTKTTTKRSSYQGRQQVSYISSESPGTIVIKTRERALYQILGGGQAMRYLVAVGKQGFAWSGTARVGLKRVKPPWTPPAEMIERKPEFEEWASGMPGGIPENPLGARALYLYQGKKDTLFRIHGTNSPSSIGTAASSGCIRMLNKEVIELYANTPVGTKVIVI
jgi:lipoprotein-anchoring transpeptidase ErfK/SrfK